MEKVKLKDSIILNGLVARRETMIDRRKLVGTRFDSQEFYYTADDPEYDEPPFEGIEELNVNMEERNPPPETLVRVRQTIKRKSIKRNNS